MFSFFFFIGENLFKHHDLHRLVRRGSLPADACQLVPHLGRVPRRAAGQRRKPQKRGRCQVRRLLQSLRLPAGLQQPVSNGGCLPRCLHQCGTPQSGGQAVRGLVRPRPVQRPRDKPVSHICGVSGQPFRNRASEPSRPPVRDHLRSKPVLRAALETVPPQFGVLDSWLPGSADL